MNGFPNCYLIFFVKVPKTEDDAIGPTEYHDFGETFLLDAVAARADTA